MKFLVSLFLLTICACAQATVIEAEDGIRIGSTDGGRLSIDEFDEYVFEVPIGSLTAGEVKTIDLGTEVTFRGGVTLVPAMVDPENNNADKLELRHAWLQGQVERPAHLKLMVKNDSGSTVNFGSPQITVGGWNTTNGRKKAK